MMQIFENVLVFIPESVHWLKEWLAERFGCQSISSIPLTKCPMEELFSKNSGASRIYKPALYIPEKLQSRYLAVWKRR